MRKRKHVFALSCLILLGGLSLSVMTGCDDVDTKQTASISIAESENGTVYANQTANLYEGDEVILSIVPDDGYELETLLFNGEIVTVSGNKVTVTLVAGVNTVEATFVLSTTSSDDPVVDDDEPDVDDDTDIDDDEPDVGGGEEDPGTGEDDPGDDEGNPDEGGDTGGDEGGDEPGTDPDDPDTGDDPGTDPDDPDTGDEGGEDNPGDDGQDEDENLLTLYVSVPEWWYGDDALTYIFTYDENYEDIDTGYGNEMEYLENPGEYNGLKYYTYTIDLDEVSYIRLLRYGYTDGTTFSFWGAETDKMAVTGEYNYFAMSSDAKYSNSDDPDWQGYATGTWGTLDVNDILRKEATLSYSESVTGGSISIDKTEGLLEGDEITVTINADEGYVLDTFYFNNNPIEISGTRTVLEVVGGVNTITYSFKEGEAETNYMTLYVSVQSWWYSDEALTYILTYDQSGYAIEDGTYGVKMTEVGTYNSLQYWSYEIDLYVVESIELFRIGSDGSYWGAQTEKMTVTGEYNHFAMNDNAKWYNSSDPNYWGYATGDWGNLDISSLS